MRKLSARWVPNFFAWPNSPHQGEVVPDKQLQGNQSLQRKYWVSTSLQKRVPWRGHFIKPELHDCRVAEEERGRTGLPLWKENQAILSEVCSPNCFPDKSAHSACSACLLRNLYAHWMTTHFIKQALHEKRRLYFTSFLLLPLLLKSSDNHSVSGCVGSCLTSLTCCVFCRRGLVLK